MRSKYKVVWKKVEPLMRRAKRKNFVLHTQMVVRAMEEILVEEEGDPDILIPAAILHDVGWSEVSEDFQLADDKEKQREALVQHIEEAPPIIRRILGELGYDRRRVEQIVEIVLAHKTSNPKEKDKQLLIDADTLSDTYKESFYSDVRSYSSTPRETWEFRSKNTFYTKSARKIFQKQLIARREEIDKV